MSNITLGQRYFCCLVCVLLTGLPTADFAWSAESGTIDSVPISDTIAPPRFLAAWGQEGTGDSEFKSPIGIAINAADDVYVTDAKNACV